MITLEPVSMRPPEDAESMLKELGAGETGFGGTDYGEGQGTFTEFLQQSMDQHAGKGLPPGWIPQTTFWILEDRRALGLLRMRHALVDATRISGGHIGYYVRPDARGRGVARHALALALIEIMKLGINSVMLTTSPENTGSNKVITQNGGVMRQQIVHPETGGLVNQYWITLA